MQVGCWRLAVDCFLIAECIRARSTLHAKAMGGGGKGWWRPVDRPYRGKGWLEVQRERFDEKGKPATGKGAQGDVPEETRGSAADRAREAEATASGRTGIFSRAPEDEGSDEGTGEASASASASTVRTTALRTHRMVEGRRASGFEPQRNTFYILGRPVQVVSRSNKTTFMCQSRVMFTFCVAHFQTSIS